MTHSPPLSAPLRRLQLLGLTLALAGGLACGGGWLVLGDRFYSAWLTSFVYWLEVGLGCLVMAMVHGLSGGAWGRAIRRVIEAGYQTLPLMVPLFAPVWLRPARIYVWAHPEVVQASDVLMKKAAYLNVSGFQWRAIVYFLTWLAVIWILNRFSPDDEPNLESLRSRRLQRFSGIGFITCGFTVTLATVDWLMSLEPEWYSTMYALVHLTGAAVSGLSCALVVVAALRDYSPWSEIVTPPRLNDLGNLLLAAVMLWAYCSFFQYLVIWSGNLPQENIWYVRRSRDGWQFLAIALVVLHFAVPFLLLLSRQLKRHATDLGRIAALLLVMRYVDLYWIVEPGFERSDPSRRGLHFHWIDLAALVAIGGAWLAVFAWRLSVRASMPLYDPPDLGGDG